MSSSTILKSDKARTLGAADTAVVSSNDVAGRLVRAVDGRRMEGCC